MRRLHTACGGRIVAKMLNALSTSMGPAPLFVHTSAVTDEDLDDLESLSLSPMIFQERIDKDIGAAGRLRGRTLLRRRR